MSKKPDTASALAGILKARRSEEPASEALPVPELPPATEPIPPPSPAPLATPSPVPSPPVMVERKARTGKSSDKATYRQFSVYLRKDTRKKVSRTLEDADSGQNFSDLVQELLEQWLTSRT